MAYIVVPIQPVDISKLLSCQEKTEHYEAQIKTITEDFNIEREERAKAHQRAEHLQEEVNRLKLQLEKQHWAIVNANRKYGTVRYECDEVDSDV